MPPAPGWLAKAGNLSRRAGRPDGRLALELGVYGTPETYLFAGDGTLLTRHTGLLTWKDLATPVCPCLQGPQRDTASQPEVERSGETSAGGKP